MSKKIYTGVENKARSSKKFYIGVDSLARKIKKMYIGDTEGKARLCYNRIFTWAKYTSKRTGGTSTSYGQYTTDSPSTALDISVSSISNDTYDHDYINKNSDGDEWYITIGDSFSYNQSNGSFSLANKRNYRIANDSGNGIFGISNYAIETELVGKYLLYDSGCIYKITGHNDTKSLYLHERYESGSTTVYYGYTYEYVGDVTSEDENAYTTGSIANYSSSNANDIRTSYVKKEV